MNQFRPVKCGHMGQVRNDFFNNALFMVEWEREVMLDTGDVLQVATQVGTDMSE